MGKGMKAGKKKKPSGGGGPRNLQQQQQQQQQQMRQFQEMQRQMEETQAEIDAMEARATAGGGAVEVAVNGKKELTEIKIDPELMEGGDPEMLQDLIIVAVNEALRQMEEISAAEMEKVTGGLSLPF